MIISLEELVAAFLERQDLQDCRVAFEPPRAGVRRAKRSTAMIKDALDPKSQPKLQGNRTVQELMERLLTLSAEMRSWTDGAGKRYVPRLYNIEGKVVHPTAKLADVRRFAEELERKNVESVQRLLLGALQASDRLLEPSQVNEVAIRLIADRNGR